MKYLFEIQKAGERSHQAIFNSKAAALRQVPARSLERKFINQANPESELRLKLKANSGAIYIIKVW